MAANKNKELIGLTVAASTGAFVEYLYQKPKTKPKDNKNIQVPKSGGGTNKYTSKTLRATRPVENLTVNISIDSTAAGGNLLKESDFFKKDDAKDEIVEEKKYGSGLVDKVKDNLDDNKEKSQELADKVKYKFKFSKDDEEDKKKSN